MKKITLYAITMVFALTLGVAYANEGNKELYNGVTDFSGKSYDTLANISNVSPGAASEVLMEGSHAGGLRTEVSSKESYNGVTDFSGRSYDTLADIGNASPGASVGASVESSNAGGPRAEKSGKVSFNGITDFSGRSYDSL
jgi:hypothetical protein